MNQSYFGQTAKCFKKEEIWLFLSLFIFLFKSFYLPHEFKNYLMYLLSDIQIKRKLYNLFDIQMVQKDLWIIGSSLQFENCF